MSLFHQNLETLRRKFRMSQKDLADRFGLSITSVGRWEKTSEARYDILVELSKLFKVSIDALLTEDLSQFDYQKPPNRYTAMEEDGERYLTDEDMEKIKAMEQALSNMNKTLMTLTNLLESLQRENNVLKSRIEKLEKK